MPLEATDAPAIDAPATDAPATDAPATDAPAADDGPGPTHDATDAARRQQHVPAANGRTACRNATGRAVTYDGTTRHATAAATVVVIRILRPLAEMNQVLQ